MDTFSIIAFAFALSALVFSIKNHERINTLENWTGMTQLVRSMGAGLFSPACFAASLIETA